jgi:CDP-glucose 4,6-dehydratase
MFQNHYAGKKVLITGNTGFKGSWLTVWLLKLGAKVYGLSKDIPTSPAMYKELKLNKRIKHHNCDIRELNSVTQIIGEISPDIIFHLAAQPLVSKSFENPSETLSTNIMGTANVLEALRCLDIKCVSIFITSDKCYDNVEWPWGYKETDMLGGKDIYSGSKGAAELIINSYYHTYFNSENSNVKIASVRAGNVIGGGDWAQDRIVPDCMRAWNLGETVEIRSPNATRPWQHVLEPLSGYLTLGQKIANELDFNGQSYNFGPNSQYNHSVINLLDDLFLRWDVDEKHEAYKITGNLKFHEASLLKLNCDKALMDLKWHSTLKYDELLEFTSAWYYEYYHEKPDMYDYTIKQISKFEEIAADKKLLWTLK